MPYKVIRNWTVLPHGRDANDRCVGSIIVSFHFIPDPDPTGDLSGTPAVTGWQDVADALVAPAATGPALELVAADGTRYSSRPGAANPLRLSSTANPAEARKAWTALLRPGGQWRTVSTGLRRTYDDRVMRFDAAACIAAEKRVASHPLDGGALDAVRTLVSDGPAEAAKFLAATTGAAVRPHFERPPDDLTKRPMTAEEAFLTASRHPELLRRLRLCFDFSLGAGTAPAGAVHAELVGADALTADNVSPATLLAPAPAVFRAADAGTLKQGFLDLRDARYTIGQIDPMRAGLSVVDLLRTDKPVPSEERAVSPEVFKITQAGLNVTIQPFLARVQPDAAPRIVPADGNPRILGLPPYALSIIYVDDSGALHLAGAGEPVPATGIAVYAVATNRDSVYDCRVLAPVHVESPLLGGVALHAARSGEPAIFDSGHAADLEHRLRTGAALESTRYRRIAMHRAAADAKRSLDEFARAFPSTAPGLTSADLSRGIVVDVRQGEQQWQPLCRRSVTYAVPGVDPMEFKEEAAIDIAPLIAPSSSGPPAAAVVDTIVAWKNGESPVLPAFLGVANDNGVAHGPETGLDGITTTLEPDGKYPALRYGASYAFRAAMQDLSGWSPDRGDAGAGIPSAPLTYRRYEPVSPPALIPPVPIDATKEPGEEIATLVFRGHRSGNENYDVRRHLLPPPIDGWEAVRHGMLDKVWNDPAGRHDAYTWLQRTAMLPAHANGALAVEVGNLPVFDPGSDADGYLPDPLATAYIVTGIPGPNDQAILPLYDETYSWPNPRPWRIVLSATDTKHGLERKITTTDGGELEIYLNRGAQATITIACKLDDHTLPLMGRWADARETPQFAALDHAVRTRGHAMINPTIELRLVHAVVEPMFAPTTDATEDRNRTDEPESAPPTMAEIPPPGQSLESSRVTFVLERYMPNESASRLDCKYRWQEWLDDPALGAPRLVDRVETLAREELPRGANAWRVYTCSYDFGSTRAKHGDLFFDVASRFAVFVTPDPAEVATSAAWPVPVLNSARPPALRIVETRETLRWDPLASTDVTARTRKATGLRVRVARPAMQTGLRECLGIVVLEPGSVAGDAALDLVTRIGGDPTVGQPLVPLDAAKLDYFTSTLGSVETARGLAHHQLGDARVAVVPYELHYDPVSDDWYADVALDGVDAYMPFVSLAVVRYQPDSLPGREMSDITVLTPFQLAPRRDAARGQMIYTGDVVSVDVTVDAPLTGPGTKFVAALLARTPNTFGELALDVLGAFPLTSSAATPGRYTTTVRSDRARPWTIRITEYEPFPGETDPAHGVIREPYIEEFIVHRDVPLLAAEGREPEDAR